MSYPAAVQIDNPERIANWRPVVQLILGIPHWVVLHTVLAVAASVTATVGWVTILATGKLPPGLAEFNATYVRYRARTFSYMQCLTDKYPPFDYKPSSDDPGGAGISVRVSPKLENRNRLTVLFRFIVPFAWLTLVGFLGLVFGFVTFDGWVWIVQLVLGAVLIPGAIFSTVAYAITLIATILGSLAVIFTGRWPDGLFRLSAGWVRVDARLWAYSMLLTDEYPPFSLD